MPSEVHTTDRIKEEPKWIYDSTTIKGLYINFQIKQGYQFVTFITSDKIINQQSTNTRIYAIFFRYRG